MKIAYRYVGLGEMLPGVPKRDLTDDDVQRLKDKEPNAYADLVASALYQPETKTPKKED